MWMGRSPPGRATVVRASPASAAPRLCPPPTPHPPRPQSPHHIPWHCSLTGGVVTRAGIVPHGGRGGSTLLQAAQHLFRLQLCMPVFVPVGRPLAV